MNLRSVIALAVFSILTPSLGYADSAEPTCYTVRHDFKVAQKAWTRSECELNDDPTGDAAVTCDRLYKQVTKTQAECNYWCNTKCEL
jgi:hypothetical protein